jgi:hypothetical protein
MVGSDGEVMQAAAATVMAAEDCGDEPALNSAGDAAESRISIEIGGQSLGGIGLVQDEACGLPPEFEGGGEVGGEQRPDLKAGNLVAGGAHES